MWFSFKRQLTQISPIRPKHKTPINPSYLILIFLFISKTQINYQIMPTPSNPCLFFNPSVSKVQTKPMVGASKLTTITIRHHTSYTLSLSPLVLSAQPWLSLYGQLQELVATSHHHLHGIALPLFHFDFSSNHGRKFLPLCCCTHNFRKR